MTTTSIVSQRLSTPGATTAQPGYISSVSLRSGEYKVFAYVLNPDGSKQYLADNCNPQTIEKVRSLTWGLLNAHDNKRHAANEAPYEIKGIDSRGLIKQDNTVVSHDFTIQPHSQPLAEMMARSLTQYGRPIEPSAIKALDVWNALDDVVRAGINNPTAPPHSTTVNNPTPPQTNPTNTTPQNPLSPPQTNPTNTTPQNPLSPPQVNTANTTNPINPPVTDRVPSTPARIPPTSIDQDLRHIDLQQPNWYTQIPVRTKLRIVSQVANGTSPLGGVYHQVWQRFTPPPGSRGDVITNLEREKRKLIRQTRRLPSAIPLNIRQKAEVIYDACKSRQPESHIKEKAHTLMSLNFPRKQELLHRIREQADAEGIVIEAWDQQWAQYHYADDSRLFAQALARWLDNDS